MLFHLRTKKFYYHIHIAHFITRDFTHHELTQDSINSRIFYCISISKSLQPCPHLIYRMNILETYGTSDLRRVPFRICSFSGSVTSEIFLIFVSLNTITLFSTSVCCPEAGSYYSSCDSSDSLFSLSSVSESCCSCRFKPSKFPFKRASAHLLCDVSNTKDFLEYLTQMFLNTLHKATYFYFWCYCTK